MTRKELRRQPLPERLGDHVVPACAGAAPCVGSFCQPAVRLASMRYHVYLEAEPTLKAWAVVADYRAAHNGLYGRYPSFARLMKNARIKDQILVFDER